MKSNTDNAQTKWTLDLAHSEISFRVKHLMIAHVKGSFKVFDANIYTHGKDFATAEIDLWIDAASVDTGNTQRDEHLRGKEFFDVARHKQITFTSSTMESPDAEGKQVLWGELTMLGITKNIRLEVQFGGIAKDPWGNEKAGFTVTAKINRADWELQWNATLETGGFLVGDDVTISCEVELINAGLKTLTMELDGKAEYKK